MYKVSRDFIEIVSCDFKIGDIDEITEKQIIQVAIISNDMIKVRYWGSKKWYYFEYKSMYQIFIPVFEGDNYDDYGIIEKGETGWNTIMHRGLTYDEAFIWVQENKSTYLNTKLIIRSALVIHTAKSIYDKLKGTRDTEELQDIINGLLKI